MTDFDHVFDAARARIATEVAGGFPLLSRVPQTRIIQLIDYAQALDAAGREALVAALAWRSTGILTGKGGDTAAFDRFLGVVGQPGPFTGGARYCPVRDLADTRLPTVPGATALPRPDLLPDASAMVPATARNLKPTVARVLTAAGFARQEGRIGASRFLSAEGTLVDLDFGARSAQLRYGVAVNAAHLADAPLSQVMFLSTELLMGGVPAGWDYLTEENTARSLAALPDLIATAVDLITLR